MVHVILHINRTFTDPFYPIFEIVYTIEISFIFVFFSLTPVAFNMLWNARPFHRNLRLSLCNLVIQGLLGTMARLIFIYNQYYGDTPFEMRSSVIIASILRSSMLEAFVGVFLFFSIERAFATFAWSWYEKESAHTLVAFVLLEGCALLWSWSWSIALIFEYITTRTLMIGFASTAIVGSTIGLLGIAVNFRANMQMKVGARVNKYSVARSYQIRENLTIFKALFKIAVSAMILNVPLFIIANWSVFSQNANERMVCRACMDLIISIYPAVLISFIPLSDSIFERSLKRMAYGNALYGAFSAMHCRCRRKEKAGEQRVIESDHYFGVLAASLKGPSIQ